MGKCRLHLRRYATASLALFWGMSMVASASLFGFGNTTSWKEEVLLHDGNKLTVERFQNLGGFPAIESHEREVLDETLTFTNPHTNKVITWKTDFRDNIPDQNGLNLLVLDMVDGVPYIATYPAGCIAYNKWKRPNPPYIFFKYENNGWQRISLASFPAQLSRINVIVGGPTQETRKSFYTAAAVQAENRDLQPEYKTILRQPFPTAAGGCPVLELYKGGWVGPGDSIGRRMMDQMSK